MQAGDQNKGDSRRPRSRRSRAAGNKAARETRSDECDANQPSGGVEPVSEPTKLCVPYTSVDMACRRRGAPTMRNQHGDALSRINGNEAETSGARGGADRRFKASPRRTTDGIASLHPAPWPRARETRTAKSCAPYPDLSQCIPA
ncbi:hypothetical protein ACJQWK_08733 [Exserohilum turcicum]